MEMMRQISTRKDSWPSIDHKQWSPALTHLVWDEGKFGPPIPTMANLINSLRACPGYHYAMGTLFISIASILAVFDIKQGDDPHKEVLTKPQFTGGEMLDQYVHETH